MKIIGQTAESSKMTSEKQLLPDMVLGGGIHLSSCTDTNYCGQDAYADMLVTERERNSMGSRERTDASGTLTIESWCAEHDARSDNDTYYAVRRLIPKECARLQGFPPDWCDDVPHSDSAEYKLWGNGIALPCLLPMMKAMGDMLRNENRSG